jgi:hypothetical protein
MADGRMNDDMDMMDESAINASEDVSLIQHMRSHIPNNCGI